ncbi:hypothetical protein EVAR_100722_1 [Eumeta japonica]|uniref:Uncharacterized protein n=1 Tax=Eumeta variegata TaxID=151549 RepID=A0A4C1ZYG9_EUMVA|nr:hypothetical protein EVAR_100722_1 [Eumeta japonica]
MVIALMNNFLTVTDRAMRHAITLARRLSRPPSAPAARLTKASWEVVSSSELRAAEHRHHHNFDNVRHRELNALSEARID